LGGHSGDALLSRSLAVLEESPKALLAEIERACAE
jgi:hypothetical protein